jgi:hypothetical protein
LDERHLLLGERHLIPILLELLQKITKQVLLALRELTILKEAVAKNPIMMSNLQEIVAVNESYLSLMFLLLASVLGPKRSEQTLVHDCLLTKTLPFLFLCDD